MKVLLEFQNLQDIVEDGYIEPANVNAEAALSNTQKTALKEAHKRYIKGHCS